MKRGDRGKFYDPTVAPAAYGEDRVFEGVEGIELLEAYERGEIRIENDGKLPCLILLYIFISFCVHLLYYKLFLFY